MSLLAKHTPGKPLTVAEHIQRRRAARARWATVAIGTITGAATGAAIATHGTSINRGARQLAAAQLQGVITTEQLRQMDRRTDIERTRLRSLVGNEVRARLRANPETQAERQARMSRLLANPNDPTAHAPTRQVVGTLTNARIYDYEIARLNQTLHRETRHLERLVRQAPEDVDAPHVRRQRARVVAAHQEITHMRHLQANRPRVIGRSGSQRQGRGGNIDVAATTERKFRQGETVPQIRRRIRSATAELNARQRNLFNLIDRRTEVIRATRASAIHRAEARAIQDNFERGVYRSRMLHAQGKGGLLGAGIGLTAAGLGILAHHLVHATHRRREVRKIAGFALELAKAAEPDSPEDNMATGLGLTYRRWIDRLLGHGPEPMNLGDGIAEAVGGGIARAFGDGARAVPIDRERSDPRSWIEVDFDQLNPATRRHMAEYALDRIVSISQAQRDAIRQILLNQSVLRGVGPKDVARLIREIIGLTPYQVGVVESYRQGLHDLNPDVLERKLRDSRYDPTIRRAIEQNEPLSDEQIDDMVSAYHRRMLALRAVTIARTEGLRATSYGGVARAQQVLDDHPELDVTKKWLATKDERTRDTHRDLDGKEVDGMETNFVTSKGNPIRWPLDELAVAEEVIQCRCTLQFIYKPKRGELVAVGVPA